MRFPNTPELVASKIIIAFSYLSQTQIEGSLQRLPRWQQLLSLAPETLLTLLNTATRDEYNKDRGISMYQQVSRCVSLKSNTNLRCPCKDQLNSSRLGQCREHKEVRDSASHDNGDADRGSADDVADNNRNQ